MASAGGFLVVSVEWDDGGETREEIYGPWAVADDDSHLVSITGFVKGWPERAGFLPRTVTLTLCVDPAAWLAGDAVTAARTAAPETAAGGDCGPAHR